jgi:capsular exopolysaccharide synthesis family protein
MELAAFVKPLARWWWLLLAATLLAAGASFWQVRQQPPVYEARTTLMIGRAFEDPNPTGNELALGQQLSTTYADLAHRAKVREQTMAALGLKSLPAYRAEPIPNTQLLQITVVDTDPRRAQAVANELANQLILQSPTALDPEDQERQAFINSQLASLEANITQTELEITATQTELESAFGALEIRDLQSEIEALETKLSTLQANYAALLANSLAGATNTIEVIEPAALPTRPAASGAAEMILIASAVAFVLAAGTAFLLDVADDTIRSAEGLASVTAAAGLPGIPVLRVKRGAAVVTRDTPQSPETDAFRALRTGLTAATAGQPGKVLLVTSTAPKEGKSLVAANLAAVLAQGDKRVLLIDADLHRPRQHEMFGLPSTYGLAELLLSADGHAWSNGSRDMLARARQTLAPLRLDVITAGADLADAWPLLGTETMRGLLATVAQTVDYVIIDSPAVLATSDALTLSTQVDGVLLVARAGQVHRRQLEQALQRLEGVKAHVIGVILNRQRPEATGYASYYRR